jgi:hypothetical protein
VEFEGDMQRQDRAGQALPGFASLSRRTQIALSTACHNGPRSFSMMCQMTLGLMVSYS